MQYADHRQRLQEERRFRLEQLAALRAETSATPRHESVARVLRTSAAAALGEIDAALARMEQGRYGLCVGCGRQIAPERLAVLPMAPLCMSCHYNEQNCHLAATTSSQGG
ncbi:MAG TPA: TraR/DksA C4-type zinc finger protein [Nocardioidaceae bacterium]|nr:TraR/DksA C4-type zinc finger protein [Nocardioidaceae bacterium]